MGAQHAPHRLRRRPPRLQHRVQGEAVHERVGGLDRELGDGERERAERVAHDVILLGGLTARYVLRRPRLGALLLVATPLVDVVLLGFTVLDLRDGATASVAHSLAAVYIGVSLAFGHSLVRWADVRFAHRFAGGPAPVRAPRVGPRACRACAPRLAAPPAGVDDRRRGLLLGGVAVVGDAARTEALLQTAGVWTLILTIDFLISFSYTLFPRRPAPHATA